MAMPDKAIPQTMLSNANRWARRAIAIGLGDPIKAVDHDDHVCRLGGGARAAGAEGDTNIRSSECWRVVNAVPHHHCGMQPLFHCNGINLVGRDSIREHSIKVQPCANRFSSVCPIACHHHNTLNSGGAQRLNRSRRLLS